MAQGRTAQGCTQWCLKSSCHQRVMSHSLPHLTLTTSTSSLSPTSPIFQSSSPSRPSPLAHGSIPARLTVEWRMYTKSHLPGCEPELIEPEDLEPGRIELDRNHGTDPYQTQERTMGDNYQKSCHRRCG